jgi:hypothetical protein
MNVMRLRVVVVGMMMMVKPESKRRAGEYRQEQYGGKNLLHGILHEKNVPRTQRQRSKQR